MKELQLADINKVLILGSGTLGLRVGLQSAISGFNTTIYDIKEDAFDYALKVHDKILQSQVKYGVIQESDIPDIKERITWTTNKEEAIKGADFINESVLENLDVKKEVWGYFGPASPDHCILTTNTSYLLPSQIASSSGHPERFCAFHFHDVFYANVVDIMPHPGTAPFITDLLHEMGKKLNQTPVLVQKENPGYIFNFMLMAIIGAAGRLAVTDIASIHDIDRSWMGNFKMQMGPFAILDEVGLETAWHITSSRPDAASQGFAKFLKSYIDQGKLGVKTGEGFYKYPDPDYKKPGFIEGTL